MLANFDELFEIVSADSHALLQESFRLRYQVFCLEKCLLGSDYCKDGLEFDEYDKHSLHSLIRYKPTHAYIGSVRLICVDPNNINKPFPIEKVAANNFIHNIFDLQELPRHQTAEISRITILPEFRPKLAVLSLLRAIFKMCNENSLTHLYAAMETRMQRILVRIGINFFPISPIIQYHGERQCFFGVVDDIIAELYRTHPVIWEAVTDSGKLSQNTKNLTSASNNSSGDEYSQLYNYM